MINSAIRYIKSLPVYRIAEYVFVIIVMLSTFFQGGENEYVISIIPILSALYVILRKRITLQISDLLICAAVLSVIVVAYHNNAINSHVIMFAFTIVSMIIIKNITFNQKYFISILLLFSIVHCIIIIIQFMAYRIPRPASTFVNPNWVALWLLVAFYFLVFEKNIFQKNSIIFLSATILVVSGLYFTLSRTTIVILIFFLAYLIYKKKLIDRRYFILAAVSAVLLLSGLIYQRYTKDKKDPFAYSRVSIYNAAYRMFTVHPFIGFGPGTVEVTLQKYFEGEQTEYSRFAKTPRMSHSTYLEGLLVMGIIGSFLLFSGLFFSLKKRMYGLPIAFFMIAGLFNNIEKSFSIVLLFAVLISFGTHDHAWYYRFKPYYTNIIFFIITYVCTLHILSYSLYLRSTKEKDQMKVYQLLRYAHRLTPYDPFYVEQYTNFLTQTTLPFPQNGRYAAIERYYAKHKKLMPMDSDVRFRLSLHYFDFLTRLKNTKAKEIQLMEPEIRMRLHVELETILKDWPFNVRYHYFMMNVLESEGNIPAAMKKAQEILLIEPEFYRVHAFIETHSTDKEEKLTHAQRMREISRYSKEKTVSAYERFIIAVE